MGEGCECGCGSRSGWVVGGTEQKIYDFTTLDSHVIGTETRSHQTVGHHPLHNTEHK